MVENSADFFKVVQLTLETKLASVEEALNLRLASGNVDHVRVRALHDDHLAVLAREQRRGVAVRRVTTADLDLVTGDVDVEDFWGRLGQGTRAAAMLRRVNHKQVQRGEVLGKVALAREARWGRGQVQSGHREYLA